MFPALAVVGFVLMLVGFVCYVADPSTAYIGVFAVGIALLVLTYVLVTLGNRRLERDLKAIRAEEARDGYVYYMTGGPSSDLPEIVDLTRRRPWPH